MDSNRTAHLYSTIRVTYEENDSVAVLVLNRPAQLNALNSTLLQELGEALDEIQAQPSVRVLILTGAGPKAFAAGADIAEMRAFTPAQATAFSQTGQRLFDRIESLPMPVIAAVNGFALGGGCELAMACDVILASKNAVFGQSEVKLGVIPGFGGSQRLTRLVGRQRARELCYSGRSVKSDEALRIGLALEIADGEVFDAALEMARSFLRNAPVAVSLCKRAINEGADIDLATAQAHEQLLFGLCFATADQKEGMAAFLEKRKARFSGE